MGETRDEILAELIRSQKTTLYFTASFFYNSRYAQATKNIRVGGWKRESPRIEANSHEFLMFRADSSRFV